MLHENISLILAFASLGLLYACLFLAPWARRFRQRKRLLPVPEPYPPSTFPDAGQRWFSALFVTFFFVILFSPSTSDETSEVTETQTVPYLVEAVQPDAPENSTSDREAITASTESVPEEDREGSSRGSLPPDSATSDIEQTTADVSADTSFFLQDSLMSLLLYSPLFILFFFVPNANTSQIPVRRKILRVAEYLLLAYLISFLYNLTGLPNLLIEWTQAPELQQISQDVQSIADPIGLAGAFISIVIITPICEEICFRGFIFNSLVRDWGMPIAATVSGLLFGAVHFSLLHFIPLSVLGIILAVSYYRSRSIWTPIAIHALFNAIGIAALITSA